MYIGRFLLETAHGEGLFCCGSKHRVTQFSSVAGYLPHLDVLISSLWQIPSLGLCYRLACSVVKSLAGLKRTAYPLQLTGCLSLNKVFTISSFRQRSAGTHKTLICASSILRCDILKMPCSGRMIHPQTEHTPASQCVKSPGASGRQLVPPSRPALGLAAALTRLVPCEGALSMGVRLQEAGGSRGCEMALGSDDCGVTLENDDCGMILDRDGSVHG
jgi:hypothetical protein